MTTRTYPTRIKAAEAWLRRAKRGATTTMTVRVVGGGWWELSWTLPISGAVVRTKKQGFGPLAAFLEHRSQINRQADGTFTLGNGAY